MVETFRKFGGTFQNYGEAFSKVWWDVLENILKLPQKYGQNVSNRELMSTLILYIGTQGSLYARFLIRKVPYTRGFRVIDLQLK